MNFLASDGDTLVKVGRGESVGGSRREVGGGRTGAGRWEETAVNNQRVCEETLFSWVFRANANS